MRSGRWGAVAFAAALAVLTTACVPAASSPTDSSPAGTLEVVEAFPGGGAVVSGWADDRDSDAPISVAVLAGGEWVAVDAARWSRPDIADAHGTGELRGFRVAIDAVTVGDVVCVSAINVGPGANSLLGCRPVAAQHLVDASPDCSAPLAPGVNLAGCDLTGRTFAVKDLTAADLRGANLQGRNLDFAVFARANLSGANLAGVTGMSTSFVRADLTNVNATRSSFSSTSFREATMTGFSAQAAGFYAANFRLTDLTQVNVYKSGFTDADLSFATLPLVRIGFENTRFTGRTLCPAAFSYFGDPWIGCHLS